MRITCSKTELRKFTVRAGKRYPNEYIEALFVIRGGRAAYDVLLISVMPHKGTKHQCGSTDAIWDTRVAEIAKETGLTWLGSIHTHNGNVHEAGPSPGDNSDAIRIGERFFAIDCINRQPSGRLKHSVKFYFPQGPLKNILT